MAYQIKVKDINGVIHTIELAAKPAVTTAERLLAIAANALGATVALASLISHGHKDDKK
jgi:hypothetical protein